MALRPRGRDRHVHGRPPGGGRRRCPAGGGRQGSLPGHAVRLDHDRPSGGPARPPGGAGLVEPHALLPRRVRPRHLRGARRCRHGRRGRRPGQRPQDRRPRRRRDGRGDQGRGDPGPVRGRAHHDDRRLDGRRPARAGGDVRADPGRHAPRHGARRRRRADQPLLPDHAGDGARRVRPGQVRHHRPARGDEPEERVRLRARGRASRCSTSPTSTGAVRGRSPRRRSRSRRTAPTASTSASTSTASTARSAPGRASRRWAG